MARRDGFAGSSNRPGIAGWRLYSEGGIVVNGIDVSDFQAGINLGTVRASGYSWVMIKATEGTGYVSPSFAAQWQGAETAGLLRGGYHYYIFDQDPVAQANAFLATCPATSGALPAAVDVETGDQGDNDSDTETNVANLSKFLQTVEAKTGVRCFIYLGYDGWTTLLGSTTGFSGHPLWVPSYLTGVTAPPPTSDTPPVLQPPPPQITAWSTWTAWQYSESGSVAGQTVDLNVFNGDLTALRGMLQK